MYALIIQVSVFAIWIFIDENRHEVKVYCQHNYYSDKVYVGYSTKNIVTVIIVVGKSKEYDFKHLKVITYLLII